MRSQPSAVPVRRLRWGSICLCLLLAACQRGSIDEAVGASEPDGAVRLLATHLAQGDLNGFARAAVPPAMHSQLEQAWQSGQSLWPLTGLPLDEHLPGLLSSLGAADASTQLERTFSTQLAGQSSSLRQTAQSLGLFGVQYVEQQAGYSALQRTHYRQLVQALSGWAMQAPLTDPGLARTAIGRLTAAVHASGLSADGALQARGMTSALSDLAPVQLQMMGVLEDYGLDIRSALNGIEVTVLERRGDQSRVQAVYHLAGKTITFEAEMVRLDGAWYMSQNLDDAQQILSRVPPVRDENDEKSDAGAKELAEGAVAGRPQTNQQMASGP